MRGGYDTWCYVYADPWSNSGNVNCGGSSLCSWGNTTSSSGSGQLILTGGGGTVSCTHYNYHGNTSQGGTNGYIYMIVDITELEAATGVTYSASSFYSKVGLFYGSKTVET